MERNSHVAEPFRPLLNLLSAPMSAGRNVLPLPESSSGADVEEDPPYRIPTTPAEIEAAEARVRTWRRNPNLPKLGEYVKMPAGPYEVFNG